MAPTKRAHETVELSDSDSEQRPHISASKAPRTDGTHDDPIALEDSDDEIQGPSSNAGPQQHNHRQTHGELARKRASTVARNDDIFAHMEEYDLDGLHRYWDDNEHVYNSGDEDFGAAQVMAFDELDFGALDDNVPLMDQQQELQHLLPDYCPRCQHPDCSPSCRHNHYFRAPQLPRELDEATCLNQVLELFPDVAHDYVSKVRQECSGVIHQILERIIEDPAYPKEPKKKGQDAERESTAEAEERQFTEQGRAYARGNMRKAILSLLKHDFPKIPVHYIEKVQLEKTHLFPTYVSLVKTQFMVPTPYTAAVPRLVRRIDFIEIALKYGAPTEVLQGEWAAARKARQRMEAKHREDAARKRDEEENTRSCKIAGTVAECATCFEETALNRMIYCSGANSHFTCFECAAVYIGCEVGQSRCRIACPHSSGCGSSFTERQLRLVPNKDLVEKLLKLQQDQDVRDAGVDDVIGCPFCDYKQVCPPLDIDFEFRCQNSECNIVSCRRCQQHTHIPLICDEAAKLKSKDTALEQRHKIEEAMTAALVRSCNRCKKPFIKDYGCNKMRCPSCGNLQCYVCSQSVTDYNHFHKKDGCPLHDNVEERHAQEVKKAETEARARVEAENPLLDKDDLEFQVSERVKKDEEAAEERRRQVAAARAGVDAEIANHGAVDGHAALAPRLRLLQQQMGLQRQWGRIQMQRQILRQRNQLAGVQPGFAADPLRNIDGYDERLRRLNAQIAEIEAFPLNDMFDNPLFEQAQGHEWENQMPEGLHEAEPGAAAEPPVGRRRPIQRPVVQRPINRRAVEQMAAMPRMPMGQRPVPREPEAPMATGQRLVDAIPRRAHNRHFVHPAQHDPTVAHVGGILIPPMINAAPALQDHGNRFLNYARRMRLHDFPRANTLQNVHLDNGNNNDDHRGAPGMQRPVGRPLDNLNAFGVLNVLNPFTQIPVHGSGHADLRHRQPRDGNA